MSDESDSRRGFLRAAVAGAVTLASPLSLLEAAAQDGPVPFELEDGTELELRKSGTKGFNYRAVRKSNGKVIAARPTGTFKTKAGGVIEVKNGRVLKADATSSLRSRGGDNFFVQGSFRL